MRHSRRWRKRPSIDPIFLLAPTSTDKRIEQVGRVGSGYLYYVSLRGITGASNIDLGDVALKIPKIRAATKLPIGVGFGIRDAESAKRVAQSADAVVIGSRIIQEIEAGAADQAVSQGEGVPETDSGGVGRMSWLQKLLPPKIQRTGSGARKTVPEGLWTKCAACDAVLYSTDLEKNLNVCPKCGHHERLGARPRLDALLDPDGRFEIGSRCCRSTRSSSRTRAAIPSAWRRRRRRPPRATRWW